MKPMVLKQVPVPRDYRMEPNNNTYEVEESPDNTLVLSREIDNYTEQVWNKFDRRNE